MSSRDNPDSGVMAPLVSGKKSVEHFGLKLDFFFLDQYNFTVKLLPYKEFFT